MCVEKGQKERVHVISAGVHTLSRTNNLFQLKQAAVPVTAEGAVLHRIASSFETRPQNGGSVIF